MRLFPTLLLVGALTLATPSFAEVGRDPHTDPPKPGATDSGRRERHQAGVMARQSAEGGPEARRGAITQPARPDGGAQQAQNRWIRANDPGASRTIRKDARFHDQQTSDGLPGEIARRLPPTLRGKAETKVVAHWTVSPGVAGSIWDETSPRGKVRYYLLSVDYNTPGLRFDYGNDGHVQDTASVPQIMSHDPTAVAAVNGDFFDIGDTGAPLGLAKDRERGVLSGRQSGWNSAFYFDARNRPQIGSLGLRAKIKKRPGIKITNVNSPFVQPGGVGVYTQQWGRTAGYRVTDGEKDKVRMVLIRRGRVIYNGGKLKTGQPINGTMLIGRGAMVKPLRFLKVGYRADVRWSLSQAPKMAITGNKFLLQNNKMTVVDDREMHPRTAVGIDRDKHKIFVLAVDGRQSFSRGYTMVELAKLMKRLGAEDALNLDGGGSTTMVAKVPAGGSRVINSPSDGFLRSVANGLLVKYSKPPAKKQGKKKRR